jgi:ATP/ADP translocase
LAVPLLPVLGAAFFISKTVDYSVFRASKEVLYVPLPFTARYRGKLTIDALIYRSTKGVVSALLSLAGLVAGVLPLRLYPLLAAVFGGFWNRISLRLPEPGPTAKR